MLNSSIFLYLYTRILDEDISKKNIDDDDIKRAIQHMHEVYRGDPENLYKDSYVEVDYSKIEYRCAYVHKYAPFHTALVYEAMSRSMAEIPHIKPMILRFLSKGPLKICSIGSGPGTDVVGLLAALHQRLHDSFSFFRISAHLVDITSEWESTFRSVVTEAMSGGCGALSEGMSDKWFKWTFQKADLQLKMSEALSKTISSSDLITLVKVVSAVACKETSKMIEKIFRVIKPGALVLFIDNASGGFQELISKAAAKYRLVPVYGPLNHQLYTNQTFNRERFGYKSCFKTRVAVQLLVKLNLVEYSVFISNPPQHGDMPQEISHPPILPVPIPNLLPMPQFKVANLRLPQYLIPNRIDNGNPYEGGSLHMPDYVVTCRPRRLRNQKGPSHKKH
ncbi:hypothetical protein CDAR_300801 [Caerostris darwini]|uniref:Uncharacterized protein n=1 Tax=Caerostris darwini TaxID=1538125 RepID=A0AAV4WB85_9ARAC|nr:hypothetical protein CDAR_300801 [Caerostris darwini]